MSKSDIFKEDFGLINQMKNVSETSIDNITEGFNRKGNKELCQFLSIFRAFCSELKLYRFLDRDYFTKEKFIDFFSEIDELTNKIGKLMTFLKNRFKRIEV